eukprot:CAMPEP_0170885242 /NCGR_PEP_ID=MMETSP0734-20130129/35702_1 /TAXON_ID=186038 /ORGANISM="Fragilariopsis kerguelensis, Strain L26-C5" /LENGTH=38 /DNA_ID= /DNA_START= /DNA_END= /DNA_ORIENTATION=
MDGMFGGIYIVSSIIWLQLQLIWVDDDDDDDDPPPTAT